MYFYIYTGELSIRSLLTLDICSILSIISDKTFLNESTAGGGGSRRRNTCMIEVIWIIARSLHHNNWKKIQPFTVALGS